jgi:hypothetical protein
MNNVTQIVQTVRQANWRVQRQWIGLFLLGLVLVAMVAGIYLNITVRATQAGREIQELQRAMADTTLKNADDETTLAGLNAIESMKQRATDLGFQPAETGDIKYVYVDGYIAPRAVDMTSQATQQTKSIYLLPEYSESLLDWLSQRIAASASSGVQP